MAAIPLVNPSEPLFQAGFFDLGAHPPTVVAPAEVLLSIGCDHIKGEHDGLIAIEGTHLKQRRAHISRSPLPCATDIPNRHFFRFGSYASIPNIVDGPLTYPGPDEL